MPVDLVRTIKDDDEIIEEAESDDEIAFEAFGEGLKQTHAWDFKPLISQMTHKERRSMASMSDRIEQKLQERKKALQATTTKKSIKEEDEEEEEDGDEDEVESEDGDDEDMSDGESPSEEESEDEAPKKKSAKVETVKKEKTKQKNDQIEALKPAAAAPQKKKKTTRTFESLGLSRPLLRAVEDLGYPEPTPIQAAAIPLIMMGKDVLGCALTGSGKTAAFLLPCLERLLFRSKSSSVTRVLVLTPTRELALQCQSVMTKLARLTDIRSTLVVGGLDSEAQQQQLRTNPDVVIATPGRLIDHILNTQSFGLEGLEVLILDEADRLLDMGFEDEINEIIQNCPEDRQTLLFSATLTGGVEELARLSLNDPVKVTVDEAYNLNTTLIQEFTRINAHQDKTPRYREACLLALCSRHLGTGTLIFVTHKSQARRLRMVLGLGGLRVGELHGNLTQPQRVDALQSFRDGEIDYLIATDVASRGLDIAGVKTVVNFNMPVLLRSYVHRVGRTARAGREGCAISFVGDGNEKKLLKEVLGKCSNMGTARSRVIDPEAIDACLELIAGMEADINDLIANERVDRALMHAEMDTKKAEESLKRQTEKLSSSWFQSKDDAKAKRKLAKEGDLAEAGISSNGKGIGKREAERNGKGGKQKKQKHDNEDQDRSSAKKESNKVKALARAAKREQKAALRRGDLIKDDTPKKKRSGPKMTNFEKKMKKLENEKLGTGKKRSKNQFKSSKRYKRR